MSGVGEGGFSGITPCFRRMSFLGYMSASRNCALRRDKLPFRVCVGVINGDINRLVHLDSEASKFRTVETVELFHQFAVEQLTWGPNAVSARSSQNRPECCRTQEKRIQDAEKHMQRNL